MPFTSHRVHDGSITTFPGTCPVPVGGVGICCIQSRRQRKRDVSHNPRVEPVFFRRTRNILSTRLGDDVKRLYKCSEHRSDQLYSNQLILQHLILLRGEIRSISHKYEQLEFACQVLFKAISKTGRRRKSGNGSANPVPIDLPTALTKMQYEAPKCYEVFLLIAKGVCTKQIASDLKISVKTVECHWGMIKQKLNLLTHHQAIVLAFRTGLVS